MNVSLRTLASSAFIGWIVLACFGLFYLFTWKDGRPQLRPDRIKFGIDLVGGTYITLEVQTEKAVDADLSDKMQVMVKNIKEAKMALPVSKTVKDQRIVLKFDSVKAANEASGLISGLDNTLTYVTEGSEIRVTMKDAIAERVKEAAVKSNIDVLRTRLDGLGVGEITIAAQGEKNIVIELPNVDDPQKAKAMIGKAALLEMKLVERMASNEDELLEDYDGEVPDGFTVLEAKNGKSYYLVPSFSDITGRLLKDSYTGFGGQSGSEIVVHFKFNPVGGQKFYELTSKNPGRHIAVIVDNKVISAPRISTPIGAEGYIHGDFTKEGASELAALLKSGAFVAPVTFEEERQIGPSLGQESIHAGLMACVFGLALLFVFSTFLYKLSGFFAFITLLYNLLIIMLAVSWMGATLTLPGLAGMVLTTGMAIDASILIFEKIREELAQGITIAKAIQLGFADAMVVILDSNITTFLVGIVLYWFGTGPIQGFAVTMMVGIISTLITGLFFLRSIFSFMLDTFSLQKLSI
ncbi:MAG: protein translocase subunit SecD [Candidatus Babeliales bacterium]